MAARWNPSSLTAQEWHAWFLNQAVWTQGTRQWLYRQAGLARAHIALEVGCGTGVIASEMSRSTTVVALDLEPDLLVLARRECGAVAYVQGDAHALPFPSGSFDLVACHYLLLWLADPLQGVREMARVVRRGGHVLACAEPDYGGRIDYPPPLFTLGQLQAQALRQQGAEPEIGRRLGEIFAAAGLQTTVGIMGNQWAAQAPPDIVFEAEWEMRENDLTGLISPEELERLRAVDRQALMEGRRTLFVPAFYALGRKRDADQA